MLIINKDKCTECLLCENDCPSLAINIKLSQIDNNCIECGHCAAICPYNAIETVGWDNQKIETAKISSHDFESLLHNNRSIRHYSDKEIPSQIIQKLVDAMSLYPSASNRRDLEITVITSQNKIEYLNNKVAQLLLNYFSNLANPVINTLLQLWIGRKDAIKLKYYKNTFARKMNLRPNFICFGAKAVIIFHAKKNKIGMSCEDSYIWATQTTNYAHTYGVGCCFNGFIAKALNKNKALRQEFEIPINHKVHACLLLGYPAVRYSNKVNRNAPKCSII